VLSGALKSDYLLLSHPTVALASHITTILIITLLSTLEMTQVDVVSISLSGMLGRIRIFARNASWSKDMPSKEDSYSPYGHHPGVNLKGWTLVADQVSQEVRESVRTDRQAKRLKIER